MKRSSLNRLTKTKPFIVLMLIIFPPFGAYLMWKNANWTTKTKTIVSSIVAVIFLLAIISGYAAPPSIQINDNASTDTIQVTSDTYTIQGAVSTLHSPSITINNKSIVTDSTGNFSHIVPLAIGNNTFTLVAKSEKGETQKIITINRTANSGKTSQKGNVSNNEFYTVVSITDGDTIKVSIAGEKKTVRFIGIDTPETKDPDKPIQCYGKEASSRMQHFVQGKNVRLERDMSQGDTDRYGRLLRYVFLEDNTHVGLQMIKEGYAREYTYSKPYTYQKEFKSAQDTAKASSLGLWAPTTCAGTTETVSTQAPAPNSSASPPPATDSQTTPVTQPSAQDQQPVAAGNVYYANCKAVRAAGVAPISRGQPGYGTHLDGDGDGVGCE